MKVAVVGSRGLSVSNLGDYLPKETTEIISGGAKGVDTSPRDYANANGIKLTEFLPDYEKYPEYPSENQSGYFGAETRQTVSERRLLVL